ncbi:MAG TPA: hypothetical protein PK231_05595 [Acidocella sp.]|nr:hypothetical protein [Acidocella sp.]
MIKQSGSADDYPGCAKAALSSLRNEKFLLQPMRMLTRTQAFNGRYGFISH